MIAFIVGFLSFILAGFGLGGGVLFVPLMSLFYGIDQSDAQYIALVAYIPAAFSIIISSIKQNAKAYKKILLIIPWGIVGAILGAIVAIKIDVQILRKLYSAFSILVGIYMCFSVFAKKKSSFNGFFVKNK